MTSNLSRGAAPRPPRGPMRRRTGAALAGLAMVVALAGCSGAATGPDAPTETTTTSAAASSTPSPGTTARASATADDASGAAETAAAASDPIPAPNGAADVVETGLRPASVTIPSIGVGSKLTALGIASDGVVEVPKNPDQAGWLDRSPAPGQQGPAVIIGHLDSRSGPAVFARLAELEVGAPVVVTRHDGTTVRFTVDGVQSFPKTSFPTAATYGPVPGPALRLITCGGTYDHSSKSYESNVVVFAS